MSTTTTPTATTPATAEQILVATALFAWTQNIERANKLFSKLSDAQLQLEIAPGKNRFVYLWGHLIAVHDAMRPLIGIGAPLHPELFDTFVKAADRSIAELPSRANLQRMWDEVNANLLTTFSGYTSADWLQKHTSVSDADFATNPLRNRLAILLSRTSHVAYHLGQGVLVSL